MTGEEAYWAGLGPEDDAERVIEVAPGEYERCEPEEQRCPSCQFLHGKHHETCFSEPPAVPAQVAPELAAEITICEHGWYKKDCPMCSPAEPKAAAQPVSAPSPHDRSNYMLAKHNLELAEELRVEREARKQEAVEQFNAGIEAAAKVVVKLYRIDKAELLEDIRTLAKPSCADSKEDL